MQKQNHTGLVRTVAVALVFELLFSVVGITVVKGICSSRTEREVHACHDCDDETINVRAAVNIASSDCCTIDYRRLDEPATRERFEPNHQIGRFLVPTLPPFLAATFVPSRKLPAFFTSYRSTLNPASLLEHPVLRI